MKRLAVAGAVLVAAVGCGGSGDVGSGSGDESRTSNGGSTPSSPSASDAAASPSSSTAARSPSALPEAADGTRLKACRDGRCEVVVSSGDKIEPPAKVGIRTLTVTEVSESGGVAYVGRSPGARVSSSGQRPGTTSYLNGMAITTVAIRGHRAVARFRVK